VFSVMCKSCRRVGVSACRRKSELANGERDWGISIEPGKAGRFAYRGTKSLGIASANFYRPTKQMLFYGVDVMLSAEHERILNDGSNFLRIAAPSAVHFR
jgi:hypothetical protein